MLTSPLQAQWHRQQWVRQGGQHAQLFPLPPFSPMFLRQQWGGVTSWGFPHAKVSQATRHVCISVSFHCMFVGVALYSISFLSFSSPIVLLMQWPVFRSSVELLHPEKCIKRHCHGPADSNCNCYGASHGLSGTEVSSCTLKWGDYTLHSVSPWKFWLFSRCLYQWVWRPLASVNHCLVLEPQDGLVFSSLNDLGWRAFLKYQMKDGSVSAMLAKADVL